MRKFFRTKLLPLLLIMALTASSIDFGFMQPSVVYAAEESTAPQQGTQAVSSIVLGKETIEIDGHLFTDEEFQTFLSNAKIYRVPFEQSSTFSLGDYGEIVGEDAQATGGLVILSNALIGVFDKIAEIMELATLEGSGYIVVGLIGLAAVRLAIQFLPDAIEINGVHINKFNSTLVGLTNFFSEHQNANPDEEIVDPDTIGTGETTTPGGGTGDTTQPGEGTGEGSDSGNNNMGDPNHNPDPTVIAGIISQIPNSLKQWGKCDQFANALAQKLNQAGIKFDIIRIDSLFGIYSDKYGGRIGINFHYGIRIGNIVYDNLTLMGMKCEEWLADLGIGEYPSITWKVVKEILDH